MKTRRTLLLTAILAVLVALPLAADWPITEKIDLDAIYRIKEEGLQRSKVMEIESYLTDVYGPRLTGSPNIKEAADWAQKTMKEWGLDERPPETWPFGRGWQNQTIHRDGRDAARLSAHRVPESVDAGHQRPRHRRGGHCGHQRGQGFRRSSRASCAASSCSPRRCATCAAHFDAPGHRYTDAELERSLEAAGRRGRGTRQLRRSIRTSTEDARSSGSTKASPPCSTSAAATAARCSCRRRRRLARPERARAAGAGDARRRALRPDLADAREEDPGHAARWTSTTRSTTPI